MGVLKLIFIIGFVSGITLETPVPLPNPIDDGTMVARAL